MKNPWPLAIVRGDDGEDVPTVADEVLAERLGFGRTEELRDLERRNADEIGPVLVSRQAAGKPQGGRPKATRLYTEEQTTLLTMFARTAVAAEQRRLFVCEAA